MHAVRFEFQAIDEVQFPAHAGNTWRGAFGRLLEQVNRDAYSRWFRPVASEGLGASRYVNPPRPFVFRAAELNGVSVASVARFTIGMNWFVKPEMKVLEQAFALAQEQGIGGGRVMLIAAAEGEVPIAEFIEPCDGVVVRFVTPTEIKKQGAVLKQAPDFATLIARTQERVNALTALYGGGEQGVVLNGAEEVRCIDSRVEWRAEARRSSRTGQRHEIGGLLGEADYEGDVGKFMPLLRLAYWTGIGRHTAWGNGVIETKCMK